MNQIHTMVGVPAATGGGGAPNSSKPRGCNREEDAEEGRAAPVSILCLSLEDEAVAKLGGTFTTSMGSISKCMSSSYPLVLRALLLTKKGRIKSNSLTLCPLAVLPSALSPSASKGAIGGKKVGRGMFLARDNRIFNSTRFAHLFTVFYPFVHKFVFVPFVVMKKNSCKQAR